MSSIRSVLADARRGHPGLHWLTTSMLGLSVLLIGISTFDHRTLLGAPLWLKPLKFALSFTLFAGALSWMLAQLRPNTLRRTGWLITACALIEMIVIVGQAARGVRSHFNDDTALDSILYNGVMATTIAVLWLATLGIAVRFLRAPFGDAATTLAVRIGIGISLAGMAVGVLMASHVGHAVGVPDGGPGLPLMGWSTTGGDLRIGHFVGMHALQLMPLGAAALSTTALPGRTRTRLVAVAGAGYLGLVGLVTWQALRAQPLLSPDGVTLAAAGVLVTGVAAGAWAILRHGTRAPRPERAASPSDAG